MDALALAHHLQTNGNAPSRLGLEPGKAPVAVHAAHERLEAGKRAKAHLKAPGHDMAL